MPKQKIASKVGWQALIGILLIVFLLGCVQTSTKSNQTPSTGSEYITAEYREDVVLPSSLKFAVVDIYRISDCSSGQPCLAVTIATGNPTNEKLSDMIVTAGLVGSSKQYGSVSFGCPGKYDWSLTYPGAIKTGNLCYGPFDNEEDKLVFFITISSNPEVRLLINKTDIREADTKAEMQLIDFNAGPSIVALDPASAKILGHPWDLGLYITKMTVQVTNTGENPLKNMKLEYELTKDGNSVQKKELETYPGELNQDKSAKYEFENIKLDSGGKYQITISLKNNDGVITSTTKDFEVEELP